MCEALETLETTSNDLYFLRRKPVMGDGLSCHDDLCWPRQHHFLYLFYKLFCFGILTNSLGKSQKMATTLAKVMQYKGVRQNIKSV